LTDTADGIEQSTPQRPSAAPRQCHYGAILTTLTRLIPTSWSRLLNDDNRSLETAYNLKLMWTSTTTRSERPNQSKFR